MKSLGKRLITPVALFAVILGGCSSPPPPPPAAPPPPPETTCQTSDNTQVMGEMRAEGQVTRETTVTRCVTQ